MLKSLLYETSTATDELVSEVFLPSAGAVSNTFLVGSSEVDLTVDIQVDMGPGLGWMDYLSGESVTAGTATAFIVDVNLPQRVAVTPASTTSTVIKVLAQSNGVK